MMHWFRPLTFSNASALLCDADGTLFASEEPAFEASAVVTNAFLAAHGVSACLTGEQLRTAATGLTFRATAVNLCLAYGIPVESELHGGPAPTRTGDTGSVTLTRPSLEHWAAEEKRHVTAHLARTLQPDVDVTTSLTALAGRLTLAVVTNSASVRLDACLAATGLASLIPARHRFSAEDSLLQPTSKPDPTIYRFAGAQLQCPPSRGIVVEDSVPGAESAVAAGFAVIGALGFLPHDERAERAEALRRAGVAGTMTSWTDVTEAVAEGRDTPARARPGVESCA